MPKELHTLLIGINDYPRNQGLYPLQAPLNDVIAMGNYLDQLPDTLFNKKHIYRLINQDATRPHIIAAFRAYLSGRAKAGDTVLLYFSGHGSIQKTHPEFQKINNHQIEETLICYDSRRGGLDLADKEIAVLLSEIHPEVHIVVIFDCCHAGDGTRAHELTLGSAKQGAPQFKNYRDLSDYLDGFYLHMKKTSGQIDIPTSSHALLAACLRTQKAYELPGSSKNTLSLFTKSLLDTLYSQGEISYASLMEMCRSVITNIARQQTPQLEPLGAFNPSTLFLTGTLAPAKPKRYQLQCNAQGWKINQGAAHGLLPIDPSKTYFFEVFEINQDYPRAQVESQEIGMDYCQVLQTKGEALDTHKTYEVELRSFFASKLQVDLELSTREKQILNRTFKMVSSPYLFFKTAGIFSTANFRVKALKQGNQRQFAILERKKILYRANDNTESSGRDIIYNLEKIARWKHLIKLSKPQTMIDPKQVKFQFCIHLSHNKIKIVKAFNAKINLRVKANQYSPDPNYPWAVPYGIMAKNTSKHSVFVHLLHFSSDYEIKVLGQSKELRPGADYQNILDQDKRENEALVLCPSDHIKLHQATDVFKLLMSSRPLDVDMFKQNSVFTSTERSIQFRSNAKLKIFEDWCSSDLEVKLSRKIPLHQKTRNIAGQELNLTLNAPIGFEADYSFYSIDQQENQLSLIAELLTGEQTEIVNFARNPEQEELHVLELLHIQNDAVLTSHPLEVHLSVNLEENEVLIPLCSDGEYIISPEAEVEKTALGMKISFYEIPELGFLGDEDEGKCWRVCFVRSASADIQSLIERYSLKS